MTKIKLNGRAAGINAVGIDVSKDKLDVCVTYANNAISPDYLTIRNIESDIIKFAQSIIGYQGKIIMESTGRHHLPCAVGLSENSLDVRIVNPLMTQKYIKSSIRKVKTDKQDSRVLAQVAVQEEKLPGSFKADRISLSVRKKFGLAASLEKQLQQLSASINDYTKTKESLKLKLSESEKQIMETIQTLRRQKDKLEKEIERDVCGMDDEDSNGRINRINSIPGLSLYAAALSSFFFSVDYLDDSKQWIAYSGMDIAVRQSGAWTGRGKLTKRGNPYLRKRLFGAAWGAVMNNQQFREYYNHLKANGRKHTEALIIIARKLIRIMFALTKNNTVFDPTKPIFIS